MPFSGALCLVLALPGVAFAVAWVALPRWLEGATADPDSLVLPFLVALAATAVAATAVAATLRPPRRALLVNAALNVLLPLIVVAAEAVRGLG